MLVVVLGVYGILRFEDLANRGALKLAFAAGLRDVLVLAGDHRCAIILPLLLLVQRKVRYERERALSFRLCSSFLGSSPTA